jgi:hypothetical protein
VLRLVSLLTCASIAALYLTAPARADAIDGHWCFDAKRLHVDGENMVTPGGRAIKGEYDRHGFAYVAPPGEDYAGQKMALDLVDDDHLLYSFSNTVQPQMWRRCGPPTS